ncbi:MAG: AGE family epimerase/isomerase [Lachnospiraceae bacterium]|nr:AGE family epimerase/isomerase [Lachnospiraceae bacterium]
MEYRQELIENVLPFWLDNAIDEKNGGVFTCLDETGKIYGRDKSVWFQGRALWAFSKAYNLIGRDPKYLAAAETIYRFLPKCTDTDGRMFFTVTEAGEGLQKRRYYFSETFAAIGCAEYYKASGDPNALKDAGRYFTVAYECFTGVRKTEPKIDPKHQDLKALSPVMIMLSTAQVMRSLNDENREKYDRIASECLNEVLHGGYFKENALLENVKRDGSFSDTPTGRIVNPGHSLEAAWFIMTEGILRHDDEVIRKGREIIDVTLPLGWDKTHGGIIAFTDALGKPPVALEWDMKLWWPQCEAMIALYMAYLHFGDEKYLAFFDEIEAYVEKHFADRKNGEWYGYLHYDNTVSNTLKGNIFKGPFHVPRLFMVMDTLKETGSIEPFMK